MKASSLSSTVPSVQDEQLTDIRTALTDQRHVLMLTNSLPFPPTNGYKMRIWAILNCLRAERCCVDLLCFGDPAEQDRYREQLSGVCQNLEVIPHKNISLSATRNLRARMGALFSQYPYGVGNSRSALMRARIEWLLRLSFYDAVLVEEADLLANLPKNLQIPLIVDHHNAEHVLLERYAAHAESWPKALYARLEARKIRHWERKATRRADAVLVCSHQDRSSFRNLAPATPIIVAPNVIDTAAYTPDDGAEQSCTVLYAGGMDWYPNRDAVRYFANTVLPRLRALVPAVEFVVAGRAPSPAFKKEFADVAGLRFTGTLPDLRPEIAKAAVCVVPLRIGSGTRLKILEAAAMGKAIVSTRIGAEGLEFSNGEEIVLADTPSEFADAIAFLLTDANHRHALGLAARNSVEGKYGLPALREAVRHVWLAMGSRTVQ